MAFIKLDRKILKWEWFKDVNTTHLWIYLLLRANWEDGKYRGVSVPKGSLTTGLNVISSETGLTIQQIRTALNHLKSTNNITVKSTNKYSLITIEKWEQYQCLDEVSTSKSTSHPTNEQQTSNKRLTTIKEEKEEQEEKEIKKEREKTRFSPPTLEEIQEVINEKGYSVDAEQFFNFYESKNWMIGKNKMKNFKSALVTWEKRIKQKQEESKGVWFE